MNEEIQNTTFSITLKTLFTIIGFCFIIVGEYIVLQKDIEEAKKLPSQEVSKMEFEFRNEKLQSQIDALKIQINELKK